MKKIFYFIMAITLLGGCEPDEGKQTGGIYGVITDKATGEPIRAAGVQLNPIGTKTVTGNEGQYEFTELQSGEYTLHVTKTGYTDLINYKITVSAGNTMKGDVQIVKLPSSLRVVNDNKQNIDALDFGSAAADITRSFSIFNDGPDDFGWEISETSCKWIKGFDKTGGMLKSGSTQPVVITIIRDSLEVGDNITTIQIISSDNGSKQLTIKAIKDRILPSLSIQEVSDVAATTATFNAKITAVGLPPYTERGFVYTTQTQPTTANTISKLTSEVNSTAEFSAKVSSLKIGEKYYVRAYAINSGGTAYSSNEVSFTTGATMPTLTTLAVSNINISMGVVAFNGNILTVGEPAYTERGFTYGTAPNPTISDNRKVASGSGTGAFSTNVTGLAEGYIYYVRAYATNSIGTVYGESVSFNFMAAMPTLTTQAVTNINIGAGSATFNGNILTAGDPAYTERGFVYGNPNSTIENGTKIIASGTNIGPYSVNVSYIYEGYTYYVRAYATNIKGTTYGNEISFDFKAVRPTLTTQNVSNLNIGMGTATFNGTILNVGDPAYTQRGFVYGTTSNPFYYEDNHIGATGIGISGTYSVNVSGLKAGTTYYVRAYAYNQSPWDAIYGDEISFNLNAVMPIVTTQSVTNIGIDNQGMGKITFNGTILSVGDPVYFERGFVWGTSSQPIYQNSSGSVPGENIGIFSQDLTNIEEGKFYVRAYAYSKGGVAYGESVSFIIADLPEFIILSTGLYVAKSDDSNSANFETAKNLCENSSRGGYTDWRLPTIIEMHNMESEINKIRGLNLNRGWDYYWSSIPETYYGRPGHKVFQFWGGGESKFDDVYDLNCRCVRK